jgi:hypothetical protein
MLSVANYEQAYVDACRARIAAQLSAYDDVATTAGDAPLQAFEPQFCGHMVMALDNYFCHRARTLEGKDGNPLNEVRLLCTSLMSNGGRLVADKQIKLSPETSVLGYAVGDEIAISSADFARLSEAFLAQIERTYVK